jgi:NTP pyrophosphatase (non-canonical NTP hydrolase)
VAARKKRSGVRYRPDLSPEIADVRDRAITLAKSLDQSMIDKDLEEMEKAETKGKRNIMNYVAEVKEIAKI